tara:strand:+ start:1224 stop:1427 length:204 start_codon:yes stop_codon:yes gene_type:complete
MNLEHLIENAIIDVKYYQGCLREAETKLDAFYIARDAKSDNPFSTKEFDTKLESKLDELNIDIDFSK